jgi:hypothetical protein
MESEVCSHKYLQELEIGLCCLSCGALRDSIPEIWNATPTSNNESDEEYQYKPLRPEEIRLILLLPGAESDPISCRVITIPLHAGHSYKYEAVSYTWAAEDGDVSKTKSIEVYSARDEERKFIKVTTNCENALRQLRRHHNIPGDYILWIDSICLNQKRISERNQQVSIMDQIYKNATQVDVCIPIRMSIQDHDYRGAMELLDSKNYVYDAQTGTSLQFNPGMYRFRHVVQHHLVQLARLFSLRYFSRTWVIQEIVLAQNVLLYIDEKVVHLRSEILQHICDAYIPQNISIPWLSQWVSVWKQAPGIILCLNMSLNCSASDTRDQVFAITGLLHPCTRAMIPIDYMSSVEDVLATAVTACIVERGDLDVLCYARLPKGANPQTTLSLNLTQFSAYLMRQGSRDTPSHVLPRRFPEMLALSPSRSFPSVALEGGCKRCEPTIPRTTPGDSTFVFQCAQWRQSGTFERLYGPLPETQILPRLKVQAYPIDKCTEPADQSLTDFLAHLQSSAHAQKVPWIFSLIQEPYAEGLHKLARNMWRARKSM